MILKWLRGVPAKDLEGVIPARVQISLTPPSEITRRNPCFSLASNTDYISGDACNKTGDDQKCLKKWGKLHKNPKTHSLKELRKTYGL